VFSSLKKAAVLLAPEVEAAAVVVAQKSQKRSPINAYLKL
jgi:hypothetical protein